MARDRMIRKKFWDDRKLAKVSRDARLTFIGMWNLADDLGVVLADPLFLKSKIYPYDQIQIQQFERWLNELRAFGFINQFSYLNEGFYYLPKFLKHQTINRPNYDDLNISQSVLDGILKGITDQSLNDHGSITERSLPKLEEEIELEEEEEKPPPTKFGGMIFKSVDELKVDCLNDRVYFVEHIYRQQKVLPEDLPERLDQFNDFLKSTGESVKGVKDYRKHFQSWLPTQFAREKEAIKQATQTPYKKADASKYQ